ncbi:band 7 protein AGAP004871 isoform X4 [Lepeophtheirus salmonis]|uniref:band 7 protein AGAP004871 isoform X4 n=1 Tax=Lepeophtheirus salmonis TaxID=72036 RepID=UPI003AF36BB5
MSESPRKEDESRPYSTSASSIKSQSTTGCQNPFVPIPPKGSSFSRFKQLSTRKHTQNRGTRSPHLSETESSKKPIEDLEGSERVTKSNAEDGCGGNEKDNSSPNNTKTDPKNTEVENTKGNLQLSEEAYPSLSTFTVPQISVLTESSSKPKDLDEQISYFRRGSFNPPLKSFPAYLDASSGWGYTDGGSDSDRPGMRRHSGYLQPIRHLSADPEGPGCCALLLALVSVLLIIATLPLSLCMCIKVVQEYERSVIFRLGRLRKGGAKGPGIFFVIPCIDTYRKVDLRTVSFDVPPQEILTKDAVTVSVEAVIYYRISDASAVVNKLENHSHSTHLLAATTLRNVLGTKHLAEILSERETISHVMETTLDEATDPWGVKVERVEIKDVRLPVQLQRAMAAEAEAAREARAKVIAAEGEQKASRALREASDVISQSPSALQLRYLQTLNTISAEKNSTIIFPVPMDVISHFLNKKVD